MQNVEKEINNHKQYYLAAKRERRIKKRTDKRDITGEEVIFIFEKVLAGWPTIKIFNTIKQTTPASAVTKKKVEVIATGNCKVFENELEPVRYQHYLELRSKVYRGCRPYNPALVAEDPSLCIVQANSIQGQFPLSATPNTGS